MTVTKSANGEHGSEEGTRSKPAPMLFSSRLALFILCMFSTFTFLLQRLNIGFALVCMVKRTLEANGTLDLILEVDSELINSSSALLSSFDNFDIKQALSEDEECKQHAAALKLESNLTDAESIDQGEFEWSKDVQGNILGSFYYGYFFTQIFGGWLVERFGARLGLISSLLAISILTLANPIAATYGPEYLFTIRLLMGATHGGALSSINIFSVRWCNPAERGFLMALAYGGFGFAAASTFPISALLCKSFGWEYIFYVTGAFGLIVACTAYFIAYDWPETHPRISEPELEYLQKYRSVSYSPGKAQKKQRTPWRSILLSVPVNAIHVTHTCFTWGFLLIGMYLPTFMKEVLYMDTTRNGIYSSLPYVTMLTLHFIVGSLFDYLRGKNIMSLTNLRKLFNTIGMVSPAVGLMSIGFLSCASPSLGILGIAIVQSLAEFAFMGGYMFSIFDMAPKYAGVLTGITNTYGVIPGFIGPIIVAWVTRDGTREQWIWAFSVSGAFTLFGALVFLLFSSCELQPWAQEVGNKKAPEEMKEMQTQSEKLLINEDETKIVNDNDTRRDLKV